jgi:predicted ester cyclase
MTDIVDRILKLWLAPPADDDVAATAFRELYTDPVLINGAPVPATGLVARVRMLHGAFHGLRHELLQRLYAPGQIAIAFRMHGTHTGPYRTPLGDVAATGQPVAIRTIDVLTLTDGKVSDVYVVSDEMGLLIGLDAVRLG